MEENFLAEIAKFRDKKYIDARIINRFSRRLKAGNLIRSQNPKNHFCTFFLPVNLKTRSVFIGDHINSGLWLPPGGHIESGESPIRAAQREYKEELGKTLLVNDLHLFNLTVTLVADKKRPCSIHFDFWYLVLSKKINFKFDQSEFYSAEWIQIDKALLKVSQKTVIESLNTLNKMISTL